MIHITATGFYDGKITIHIPFPEEQFETLPAEEPNGGAYCASEHYVADKALDINLQWVDTPGGECGFGSPDVFDGIITACPERVAAWFDEYKAEE